MKRLITGIGILLACGIALVICANVLVIVSSQSRIEGIHELEQKHPQALLVLGAAVTKDEEPSGILKDRLDAALELYHHQVSSKIIVSGNKEPGYDEPTVMKNYLIEQGVPSQDIYCDYAGYTTYESLIRAKQIFGVQSLVICTQEYHLYRALYTAQALGLQAWGFDSSYHQYKNQGFYDMREWGARTKALFQSFAQPAPRVNQAPISLDASGDEVVRPHFAQDQQG